jgi:hypothetical protein
MILSNNELEILIQKEDRRVTLSNAREHFGGCIPGWVAFSDTHRFVWVDVVRHGLLASELFNTNDAMAISLVNYIYTKDL